ncbi:MAG: radical SAM protein [Candidatus Thermoplasmatota archaeon]|nr:radical SAM protein [Candidatus Thermoplasmatota archaeon]
MIASWNVTNKCNLLCEHCYREAGRESEHELTTREGFSLLDEIAKAGFKLMVFSGGEPFMREDILELTRHAACLGLRPVYGSNGTLLTPDMARRVKKAGGASVAISLHMMDGRRMDEFCGVPNTFEKSLQAMRNCAEAGLPFQVNTTVFDRNIGDVEQICELAKEMGAKSHHILFLVPTGRGQNIEDETLREVQYERLIRRLLRKRQEMGFDIKPTCAPHFMRIAEQLHVDVGKYSRGCLAGISYCSIIPNGDVWPCPYLPLRIGNVRETPFSELWAGSPVFQKMRLMEYSGQCGGCEYRESCGGCRARAHFYYNDYMAHEPWCSYRRGSATNE